MKTQLLNVNTRIVINENGKPQLQGELTPTHKDHEANKYVEKEEGWHKLSLSDTCGGLPKPQPPKGESGDYLCFEPTWVWVPVG